MYMIIYWSNDDSKVYPFTNDDGDGFEQNSIKLFDTLEEADKIANDFLGSEGRVISIEGVHE